MRVAILDDYQAVALQLADWSGLEATVFASHLDSVEPLAGFEVIVAMRERMVFDAARLAALPSLRLLVTTGMANASIDLDAAAAQGVTVCGTGALTSPTVELTWGLILALARRIAAEDAAVRDGRWQHTLGVELAGKTLGVVGYGRLGSRVAAIGRAFEMEILAWSQNLVEAEGATVVSKEELLSRSDVVTVHYKLSERSRGLIGAAELERMKPTALLINTSRGPLVDEDDLLAALRAGTIAGAALDTYDIEPLPVDHPLRTAPNTVLTPHIGYVSAGNYERFYGEAVEDIHAFLAGSPIRVL
jgi:phosphoglycerate dehydrogenase-like enzyme